MIIIQNYTFIIVYLYIYIRNRDTHVIWYITYNNKITGKKIRNIRGNDKH